MIEEFHVQLRDVTKKFGDVTAVDHVDLDVRRGEFLTLLGPSGCGKTTTLRLISGLERPDAGTITINGKVMSDAASKSFISPEKRGLGMVFQSYAVWPHMTVFKNIAYPLKIRKLPKNEIEKKVMKGLNLTRLEGLASRYPHQLSGGQQQRVALARAIVTEPEILLFDEPLSNLDAQLREQMRFELKDIQRRLGVTSIYVTHDQMEAMVISDRLAIMHEGKVQQLGTSREIYEKPQNKFTASFIGLSNFIDGKVSSISDKGDRSWSTISIREGWEIRCKTTPNLKEEDSVLIMIRPEDISLQREKISKINDIEGKIEKKVFLGDRFDIRIRGKDKILRVQTQFTDLEEGDKVHLYLDPEKCYLIPA